MTAVVHRTSMALGEPSPLFGNTLDHLLLVADTGGESADARVRAIAVQTIADYMLDIVTWFYRLGVPHDDDFLQELVSALEQCHKRVQAVANATPGSPEVGAVLTMAYVTWPWVYVIHVGTCRCYLQRNTALEQITTGPHPGAATGGQRRTPSARERHITVEQCAVECHRRGT
jgi:protein phosphatase